MEDVTKFECIFCGQEVPILRKIRDQPKDKSAILKLWNNECAKTTCEILLGGEYTSVFLRYFQDYNFCANCDQTVRDIQYFIYQIEAFKKRIHTLTQLIRGRLLESSRHIISQNTEKIKQPKTLETRISTLIAKGPNGLKLYTHQQISEIMYKMASDKCSKDAETDKSHFIHSNTDGKSKLLKSEYNYEEMDLEFKTEPEEYLINDYNNMEDIDYTNESMSDHNSYSKEEEIFNFEETGLSDRKVRQLQSDWRDDDTNSGSEDNEDPLSGAGDTYWDESDLKLNDHSTKRSNKRSGKGKTEEELPAREGETERERKRRLNIKRATKRRREKRIAARIAKLSEDPVQKIVLMLNPEPTEEERLALQKMTPEERNRIYKLRYNKKRRDIRLAEKIVSGCVCRAENCGMAFPSKDEADAHYREIHEVIKVAEVKRDCQDEDTHIGSKDNGDANIGSDNKDKLSGTGDTSWDESVLKLIDSRKQLSGIRRRNKQRARTNEEERKQRFRLSQIRYTNKRREKRVAARLATLSEVQKIAVMLNPEPTEEERLAMQKMTPEERRQIYKIRHNKKRRNIRLAEKMIKNFVCPAENCRKIFTKKNEADGHYREIHEGCTVDAYHCGDCPQKFSEYKLLYDHNKEREICGTCIGKDECKFCGKLYTTEADLNVHLSEAHTGSNPFDCAFCEMEFTNSVDLRKHTEELHLDVGKFICEECGKVYPSTKINAFNAHKSHHRLTKAGRVYNCEPCSKSFPSVGLLRHHQSYVHDKSEKFICEICSKECFGKKSWRQHRRSAHGRRYKCNICDKTYGRASVLRDHEISHTGIRNFVCQSCGKAFLTKPCLKAHQVAFQGKCVPPVLSKRKSKKKLKTSNVNKPVT